MMKIAMKAGELSRADLDVCLTKFLQLMGYDASACELSNRDIAAGVLLGIKFFVESRSRQLPAILPDPHLTTGLLCLLDTVGRKHLQPHQGACMLAKAEEIEQFLATHHFPATPDPKGTIDD